MPLWYKNTERKKNLLTFKRDFIVFINDLDSPLQKRQGSPIRSPGEGYKDDKGLEASPIQGKGERPGLFRMEKTERVWIAALFINI